MMNPNRTQATLPVKGVTLGGLPTKEVPSGGQVIDYYRGDDQPLYERKTMVAGLQTEFTIFDQGHNGNIEYPTTNVPTPNQIPGELQFDVYGFSINFVPTAANVATELVIADVRRVMRPILVLYKNRSPRFRLWTDRVGGGGGIWGQGTAGAISLLNNGMPSVMNWYHLFTPIPYQAEENFSVALLWDQGGVTTSVNMDVECTVYGLRVGMLDRT